MLNEALQFILETLLGLFLFALLLRFYLQLLRAPFHHPFCQFITTLTDFAVLPLRRLLPSRRAFDPVTLLLAFATAFLLHLALLWLQGFPLLVAGAGIYPALALLALARLIKISLYLLIAAVFLQALASWINPRGLLMPLLALLTRPFLRPLQKRVPPVANVDLSPLIIFILCQLLLILPVAWLEHLARSWL